MALGAAALIGTGVGALANFFIGQQQKKQGRRLARKGRKDMLATARPTAELLAGVDETKGLIEQSRVRGEERLDSSVSGFLDALSSGDQSQISAMVPGFSQDVAQASSDLGLQTAASMAQANQPAIDAAERAMDVSRSLAGMDLQQGTEAFNKGRQLQLDAVGQVLNTPMDLAALQTANPQAFGTLFPAAQSGMKVGQEGAYTGGGINMRTIKDLLAALPDREGEKEKVTEEEEVKEGSERQLTPHQSRMRKTEETEEERKTSEDIERRRRMGKGEFKMGGTMGPGDVFKTPGPEDHDKKEFDIVDAESGQTVARTTGQENHTINNDDPDQKYKIVDKDTREVLMKSEGGSMSVLNSDQSESIHDAFKDIDVPMLLKFLEKYPQKGQVRDLMSALNVFTLPQFQD